MQTSIPATRLSCRSNHTHDAMAKDQPGPAVQVDAAAVFDASVQLPMFDKTEPDAWYILTEANFNLRKVTDSRTKYWYVLSKFDATTLRKLSMFLKLPRGKDQYQELRDKPCETFEPPSNRSWTPSSH